MLTAFQELMKLANLIQKSQNVIQRKWDRKSWSYLLNKAVFQRYTSKKWIKDPIFYYNTFSLSIEKRRLVYISYIYLNFCHLRVHWLVLNLFDSMEYLQQRKIIKKFK